MTERGDVVLVVVQGDFGKVRPAVIVQSGYSLDASDSMTVCLITSDLHPDSSLRVVVQPSSANGLKKDSQIQADKVQTVRTNRIGETIGHLEEPLMRRVDRALALHLNLYSPH